MREAVLVATALIALAISEGQAKPEAVGKRCVPVSVQTVLHAC